MIAMNKDQDACRLFTECITTGEIYDIKLRQECLKQLQKVFLKYGH